MMRKTAAFLVFALLLPCLTIHAEDPDNRVLTGSANFGNVGRHMGVQSLGSITITGDGSNNAHTIRIGPNGYAYFDNGILLKNTSGSELVFDGPNQSHDLDVFFFGTGQFNQGGGYNVQDFALPESNSYVNGEGQSVAAMGGNWFWSADFTNLTGEELTFTADDFAGPDTVNPSALSPITFAPERNSATVDQSFNRVDSPRPVVPNVVETGGFDFNLDERTTPTIERQNTLFQVDAAAEGVPAPALDLSGIDLSAEGVLLRDRNISAGSIDLGRQIVSSGTEQITRNDTIQVTTFGASDQRTNIQLNAFDISSPGVQASLDSAQIFDEAADSAQVNLSANFQIDRSQAGTFSRFVDAGSAIQSLENLEGERPQDSLGIGYTYANVLNNNALSASITVLALEDFDTVGTDVRNHTVRREFSTETHTRIGINSIVRLDGSDVQQVNLSQGSGIFAEGLAGETVVAQTSYNVHTVRVKGSILTSNAGSVLDTGDSIELANSQVAGPNSTTAIIVGGSRTGSSRWTVPELDGFQGVGAGENFSFAVQFDDSNLPAGGDLGRNFRTRIDLSFQDGLFNPDSLAVNGTELAGNGPFGILGSAGTSRDLTWFLEKATSVEGDSGSATLNAVTTLLEEGINLTNTADNSSGQQNTVTFLDSEVLNGPVDLSVAFTNLNDAGVFAEAEGFDLLVGDIVDVTGLDGTMHVIEIDFDGSLVSSDPFIAWYNEGTEAPGDEIWMNAVLGNSNISDLDLVNGTANVDGQQRELSAYLRSMYFRMSYNDYLVSVSATPLLGAHGFDEDRGAVWAVIDHNSSFAASVPEPSSLGLLALGTLICLRRRNKSRM